MSYVDIENKIFGGLLGFATADALGVPIEFTSRSSHTNNFLKEMVGYGSHFVPAGTWSDDTSMTIATMDSICKKNDIDYDDIMNNYCKWAFEAKYTATDKVFDIGIGTRNALSSYYSKKTIATESGGKDERNNGNGSLMRMLPIVFFLYYADYSDDEIYNVIGLYSGLTHGHEVSKLGCHIYYDFMKSLLDGKNIKDCYSDLKIENYEKYYDNKSIEKYKKLFDGSLNECSIDDIKSSGYVVNTLEACIWSLLHSDSYENAVVTAVNLGDDTDTVGAITGSMAGVFYGKNSIPNRWYDKLAKKDYLIEIASSFSKVIKDRFDKKMFFSDDFGFNHDQDLYNILTSKS